MKMICPCCGATLSIEALLMDGDARAAVAAALRLPPPLSALLLRYIALFRPAKRALGWDRAAKLLTELQISIDAREVRRDGMTYSAPLELWQAAIESMLTRSDKLQRPLKSHGYLYEVVAGMANKAGAKAEQQREQRLRQPREGTDTGPRPLIKKGERPEEWKNIVKKVGSKPHAD